MNYLAHVFLAGPTHASRFGNLLGDFMRGVDLASLPAAVRDGVEQHRRVDAFTDRHPLVKRSHARLPAGLRRFAGILVDVFHDHLLTRHWQRFAADLRLTELTADVYRAIDVHWHLAPERLRRVAAPMQHGDWLASYGELENVDHALRGLSGRMRRANPIGDALPTLLAHDAALERDFLEFFPALIEFTRNLEIPPVSPDTLADISPA